MVLEVSFWSSKDDLTKIQFRTAKKLISQSKNAIGIALKPIQEIRRFTQYEKKLKSD